MSKRIEIENENVPSEVQDAIQTLGAFLIATNAKSFLTEFQMINKDDESDSHRFRVRMTEVEYRGETDDYEQ